MTVTVTYYIPWLSGNCARGYVCALCDGKLPAFMVPVRRSSGSMLVAALIASSWSAGPVLIF